MGGGYVNFSLTPLKKPHKPKNMKDRIALIRSIHQNVKKESKEIHKDFLVDPDNVGSDYFDRAENAKGRAENVCDDDIEGQEFSPTIAKLFDRPEQFEKEFEK